MQARRTAEIVASENGLADLPQRTRPCGYVAPAQQVGAMDLVGRLGESVLPVIVCV